MRGRRKQVSAFLLVEHLTALTVFVVSMTLMLGLLRMLYSVQEHATVTDLESWHVFVTQLDDAVLGHELMDDIEVKYRDVTPQHRSDIILRGYEKAEGKNSFAIKKNHGHVPILVGHRKLSFKRMNGVLQLQGEMAHGMSFKLNFHSGMRVIRLIEKEVMPREETGESASTVSHPPRGSESHRDEPHRCQEESTCGISTH